MGQQKKSQRKVQQNSTETSKTRSGQRKTEQKRQMGVMGLVITLVVVLAVGVLFVGAVSGWFDDGKVSLSQEYYNQDEAGLIELSVDDYNKKIDEKKSFVLFVDQTGCTTADKLRGYIENWAKEKGVKVEKMMLVF